MRGRGKEGGRNGGKERERMMSAERKGGRVGWREGGKGEERMGGKKRKCASTLKKI